jgi:hypothetical protein
MAMDGLIAWSEDRAKVARLSATVMAKENNNSESMRAW